jgi:hypothetical protein
MMLDCYCWYETKLLILFLYRYAKNSKANGMGWRRLLPTTRVRSLYRPNTKSMLSWRITSWAHGGGRPWADIGSLYAFRKISVVGDKYRGTYALVQAVQSNKCEQCRQEVYPFFREVQIRSFHVLKSASESGIWMMQVYVLFMTLLCICLNNLFRCRRRVLLLFVWSSVGTCNYSVAAIHGFFFGQYNPELMAEHTATPESSGHLLLVNIFGFICPVF